MHPLKLILVGCFALAFLLLGGLGMLLGLHFQKPESKEGERFYCGTTYYMNSLPESDSVFTSHPGFLLFKRDCKVCHGLNHALVGPGLAEAVEHKSPTFLTQLLIQDPGKRLKRNRAYQKRAKAFGGSWHEEIKFGSGIYSVEEQKQIIDLLLLLQALPMEEH